MDKDRDTNTGGWIKRIKEGEKDPSRFPSSLDEIKSLVIAITND